MLLEKDCITEGVLSDLLETYIQTDSSLIVKKSDLQKLHSILFSNEYCKTYGKFPETIYESIKKEPDMGEKLLKGMTDYRNKIIHDESIEYYPEGVVLFHDGIYGSAFGRFNYIYRAKGFRILWHQNGKINYHNVYVTIDGNGFQYFGDEIYGEIDLSSNEDDLDFEMCFNLHDIRILLSNLLNIKEHFYRDYILEYVITPPDVDKLSEISCSMRNELWRIIFKYGEKLITTNSQNFSSFSKLCNLFSDLNIQPTPSQIAQFLISVNDSKNEVITIFFNSLKTMERNKCDEEALYNTILTCCYEFQAQAKQVVKEGENEYNTYLSGLIKSSRRELTIKDQTLRGESNGGKKSGELDIYIEKNGCPMSVIEALIVNCVDKKYISMHINKIWKYDTAGNKENYLIIYYTGTNLSKFILKYKEFIATEHFDNKIYDIQEMELGYTNLYSLKMTCEVNGFNSIIRHIIIKI